MSASLVRTAQTLYFGKVPSRGDFVRSNTGAALSHGLDEWLSRTMVLMAEDTHWKIAYDDAAPVYFAILGMQSHAGLAGYLVGSRDASGRRFPFVMAASFEVPRPAEFAPHCPQALGAVWQHLDASGRQALDADDFAQVQELLTARPMALDMHTDALRPAYTAFAQEQTLERFERAVSSAESPMSLRQTMLALGLLLRPVLAQGHTGSSKSLVLPLSEDPRALVHALTLWTDLVSRFFKRTAAELALFITLHGQRPVLIVGFNGASPATLHSALVPAVCLADNVIAANADWVEDCIDSDPGLRKLSNQLRDPSLSLASATDMFRDTFLGGP